ncbi:TonB-dependent receptor [Ideonella sp.]|uniref:TonB-dependent receptor n=1 Tax=Ideonella sp. TaxID=1929293 RepID=UPI003BB51AB2
MKISNKKRDELLSPRRSGFKVSPVAAGCAALMLSSVGAVYAQEAAPAGSGAAPATVVVTGIRKGIEDAISVKKNADTIVEAISAEDIGKLPDTTIAESLARLPGVTSQRTRSGNASNISIRGLGPDFNGYLLNGREQTSTGDSRAVDLSVYPAELIGGATVYKTSDAGLMTAGLAGTIDNRLVQPLAFGGRVVAASAQRGRTGISLPVEGTNHRYSLTYIDQFADRTIGVALGFVKADGSSSELGTGGWGGATVNATLKDGTQLTGVSLPAPWGNGIDYRNRNVSDKRDGLAAIIEYRPNKTFTSQLDFFKAKIDNTAHEARFQGGLGTAITNATVVDGVATQGTFQLNPGPNGLIARTESIFDDDKILSIGWKNTLKFGDGWTAVFDLNHNSAKRVERDIEAYAGIPGADTLSFDTTGGGTPQFTLGNAAAYTDPNIIKIRDQTGWSGINGVPQAGYSKGPTLTDKVNGMRLDFSRPMAEGSMFTDLQFGGNYTKRTKDRVTDEGLIVSTTGGGHDSIAFPTGAYIAKNVGGTGLDMLTFDPKAGLWPGATILRKYNDDILSKTWGIEEKVTTGYAKLNIDTQMADIPVRGNVGLQIVNTDQSSTGFRAEVGSGVVLDNPAGALSKDGTKYTDFLPSLNLSGDLGSGNVLRFAVAEQIARATLTDLRNSFAASVDTNAGNSTFGKFIGSAGNPHLKPFKATALDLSYEKYFGSKAYVSLAGFYKNLSSYITPATNTAYDFTTYANELGLTIPPGGATGVFTTTVNGSGGNVKGFELTASAPFSLVSSWLDGFGANGSFSSTTSSVKLPNLVGLNPSQQVPTDGQTIPLPGLSKTNSKITLYFERWGFSAFVAQNYRSTYVGSVANDATGGYPTLRYIEGSRWVSAQVGYEFQDGSLKGLGFRVEGNNLNNPTYRQLRADGTTDSENKTGHSVTFRLNYKFQ